MRFFPQKTIQCIVSYCMNYLLSDQNLPLASSYVCNKICSRSRFTQRLTDDRLRQLFI